MKKILALLLIATLLLGISAFATEVAPVAEIVSEETVVQEEVSMDYYSTPAPSKVYFHLDFEDYASVEEFLTEAVIPSVPSTQNAVTLRQHAADNSTAEKKATIFSKATTSSKIEIVDNDLGGKSLAIRDGSTFYFVPENAWNSKINSDESFVISFEMASEGLTFDDKNQCTVYNTSGSWWFQEPAEGEEITVKSSRQPFTSAYGRYEDNYFNIALQPYNNQTGVKNNYVPTKESHTVAQAVKYKVNNSKPDETFCSSGVLDGKKIFTDTGINEKYKLDLPGCDTFGAYSIKSDSKVKIQYSDIKMYSIKKTAGSFNLFMDETTGIAPNAGSVTVKFSQPVPKRLLTADVFSMTEDGLTFTGFEVGRAKTYVDETTGQIGTEVELIFPYGLKSNKTYEVVANSTLQNEVALLTLGSYNTASFETAAAPANTVSILGKAGLEGGNAIANLTVGQQAKFTAKVESAADAAFIILGIYNGSDELVSYTYAKVNQGEEISLAGKIETDGMTVKAFSAGNLYNLEPFSNPDNSKIN